MVSVRASSLAVNGVGAPLLEAGPADAAEAVVFVHGNPGSSQDWLPLVAEVGAFARAIAFDQPGYGQADKPADFDYTVGGYAAYLGAALDQLGVERAHLVLHDFGGPWGLVWAAGHAERFRSVVLINTGVFLGYRWHRLARIWRTPVLGELFMATTTRAGMRLVLGSGNPRPLPRPFLDRMYDDFDRDTRRAVLRLYRATDDPAGLSTELAAVLRPLDRPALVVWGRHDPYIPVAVAERQVEVFPSVETVLLDAGHWPFVTHADEVEAAVTSFLERVTAGGA